MGDDTSPMDPRGIADTAPVERLPTAEELADTQGAPASGTATPLGLADTVAVPRAPSPAERADTLPAAVSPSPRMRVAPARPRRGATGGRRRIVVAAVVGAGALLVVASSFVGAGLFLRGRKRRPAARSPSAPGVLSEPPPPMPNLREGGPPFEIGQQWIGDWMCAGRRRDGAIRVAARTPEGRVRLVIERGRQRWVAESDRPAPGDGFAIEGVYFTENGRGDAPPTIHARLQDDGHLLHGRTPRCTLVAEHY